MPVPVQISFRDMPVSDAVEAHCWSEAEKLQAIDERISTCRIVVHETKGRGTDETVFRVRIELNVAGETIVIDRDPPDRDDDISVAVREAFEQARQRLPATQR